MRLTIINEDNISTILQQFVDLNLVNSPTFEIVRNVQANDLDQIDGEMVTIPISVISYDTMEKYIVPRGDGFLIPVPKSDNWAIYYVSYKILQSIIARLSNSQSPLLNDFYNLVDDYGKLYRMYY